MITFRLIFGFIPVPIIWTDRWLDKHLAGRVVWCGIPLCIIRPKYRNDRGLIEHELTHCKQFWRTGLIVHLWLYNRNKQYRLDAEVEAYQAQLAHYPTTARAALFVSFIATRYNLNITQHEALRRLLP